MLTAKRALFSRREFVKRLAGVAATAAFSPGLLKAATSAAFAADTQLPHPKPSENLYLAFNRIGEEENGESDEFTTLAEISRLVSGLGYRDGTRLIAVGARTGHAASPYALPGEIAAHWRLGTKSPQWVTNPDGGRVLSLGETDPIVVAQVGVLHDETKIAIQWGSERSGSVLWTFQHDATAHNPLGIGLHNAFRDIDHGLLDTLFSAAQPRAPLSQFRSGLVRFFPSLAASERWHRFEATFPLGLLHSELLSLVRARGWPGAAVVLRGLLDDVVQFHIREWVRKSPAEPAFQMERGTHLGSAHVRFGREVSPGLVPGPARWTCVGFLWDLQSSECTPPIQDWEEVSDIFGQDFHLHGFRDDGAAGGHILHCTAAGPLSISLFPLHFVEGQSAALFDDDLTFLPGSLTSAKPGVEVTVWNHGRNILRHVVVELEDPSSGRKERATLPLLKPEDRQRVRFQGAVARAPLRLRCLQLDPDGDFLQGGRGRRNDRLTFDAGLNLISS